MSKVKEPNLESVQRMSTYKEYIYRYNYIIDTIIILLLVIKIQRKHSEPLEIR